MLLTGNDVSVDSIFFESVLFSGFQGSGEEQATDSSYNFPSFAWLRHFQWAKQWVFLREITLMQNMLYNICNSARVGKGWFFKNMYIYLHFNLQIKARDEKV